jgi:hypothetical protein
VATSLAVDTDGRTVEGKAARLTVKHLTRLFEDLNEVRMEVRLAS